MSFGAPYGGYGGYGSYGGYGGYGGYGSYGGYGGYGGGPGEALSDALINQSVPGGVNSPLGEVLDNMIGGNPNPTYGQIYGGAPGVGGFPGYY